MSYRSRPSFPTGIAPDAQSKQCHAGEMFREIMRLAPCTVVVACGMGDGSTSTDAHRCTSRLSGRSAAV